MACTPRLEHIPGEMSKGFAMFAYQMACQPWRSMSRSWHALAYRIPPLSRGQERSRRFFPSAGTRCRRTMISYTRQVDGATVAAASVSHAVRYCPKVDVDVAALAGVVERMYARAASRPSGVCGNRRALRLPSGSE